MGKIPSYCGFYPWKQRVYKKGINGWFYIFFLKKIGIHMPKGSNPEDSCYNHIRLRFSTFVSATVVSISKWWDIHPTIHGFSMPSLDCTTLVLAFFILQNVTFSPVQLWKL